MTDRQQTPAIDGNAEQFRRIVTEAVKQEHALTQKDREGGLRSQATAVEKVVGSILIALVLWVGVTVKNTDTRVAVIESRLNDSAAGRYTADDAERDQKIVGEQISALSARVSALESLDNRAGQ